jgi:hypothetical protein
MAMAKTRFSRAIIYCLTLIPLLVTLGFYFIQHVPARQEYFINLRFRTLAVIGKQIESKVEAISSGLTYGKSIEHISQVVPDQPTSRIDFESYVHMVFPGLRSVPASIAGKQEEAPGETLAPISPDIQFLPATDRIRFSIGPKEKQWEDSLARLVRPFTDELSFDDVLLVDKNGDVLFQRIASTPKARNIANLLKKQDTKETGALPLYRQLESEGTGYDTDLLKQVDLDGSTYHLFAQPLTILVPRSPTGETKNLILCGLARSQRLRQEAMHVPPRYLAWIIVPLLAGLLSGPFLKLVLVKRTGRFQTRDLLMLAFFSCLAMALLAVVLLTWRQDVQGDEKMENELKSLAARMDQELREDFQHGRQLLRKIDAYAADQDSKTNTPMAQNRVRVWSDQELIKQAEDINKIDFEFVFWTSPDGFQIEKWTPLETNTPFYPQSGFEHYELARTGRYWYDEEDLGTPFTAQLMISPTTSAPIAVLTIPSERPAQLSLDRERPMIYATAQTHLRAAFISLVATPRSLLSPVVPPQTGYAIVKPDGSVIYHSNSERILNENLFREVDDPENLVNAISTRTEGSLEGSYRGRDVVFYVRPVSQIVGLPWTIVVYRDLEPMQTYTWQVFLDTLSLYLLLWIAPGLVLVCILLFTRWRTNANWAGCRILALRFCWPQEGKAGAYLGLIKIESAIVAVFLALMAWAARRPDGIAGNILLAAAFSLPLLALGAWVWILRRPSAAGPKKRWRHMYVAGLSLGLVMSSVLPVTAFYYLSLRLESSLGVRDWDMQLADLVLQHRSAAQVRVRESQNMTAETKNTSLRLALPAAKYCDNERLYEAFEQTRVGCAEPRNLMSRAPSWMEALRLLRTRAPGGLEAETIKVGKFSGGSRALEPDSSGAQALVLMLDPPAGGTSKAGLIVESGLPNLPLLPEGPTQWMLCALLLAAGCVWVWNATSRIFLFGFREIPLRTLQDLPPPQDLNHPILVLGLPRSGKDSGVRTYLKQAAARIDLKDEKLDQAWLQKTLASLEILAGEDLAAKPDAAASQEITARRMPEWVHITNLDAALSKHERRDIALQLLDALLRIPPGQLKRKIVVTCVVDPMLHLDSIFPEQNEEVERDRLPETEFGRWAHVLLQFERVLTTDDEPAPDWTKKSWGKTLWVECRHHRWLRRIGTMIAEEIRDRISRGGSAPRHEALIEELHEKAFVLYKLFWSACTRPEKLMLVQLAQTGMINPLGNDTLQELLRKGLVVRDPYPKIMNESFAHFLNSAASPGQISAWEKEAGESHWPVVRNVFIILIVFALVMVGISQNQALQTMSAIVTAVAGAIGGSFKLTDMISQKLKGKVAPA